MAWQSHATAPAGDGFQGSSNRHTVADAFWRLRTGQGGSVSAPDARLASFFDHSSPLPVFAPTSPNNLEYLLTMSKNLAHPLHPVYDNDKGGGWKWWE